MFIAAVTAVTIAIGLGVWKIGRCVDRQNDIERHRRIIGQYGDEGEDA
ncbi:MAG: hypothetical protein ACK4ZW_05740 [Blastomonas sp.]